MNLDYKKDSTYADSFPAAQYKALMGILKRRTGMDLTGYREGVARRRIARRVRTTACHDIEEYLDLLLRDEEEAHKLVNQITIHVSQFFRNPEVFGILGGRVFKDIFSRGDPCDRPKGANTRFAPTTPVKIWSAGCAEGEEVYSVAIILLKSYSREINKRRVKIVGTDVNPFSLDIAREGRYEGKKLALVDDISKRRYFRFTGGAWEVKPRVRELVEFRSENLFDGPGVTEADVILARNLLIYFDRERQEHLLTKLLTDLRQGGYLVLGKSETLPARWREVVRPIALRERVYRKIITPQV